MNVPVIAGVATGVCAVLATIAVMALAHIPEQAALGSRSPTIVIKGLQGEYGAGENIHFLAETQGECTKPGFVIENKTTKEVIIEAKAYPITCPYNDDPTFPRLTWDSKDVAGKGREITIDKPGTYSLTVILYEKQVSRQFRVD